jgi:hypothetical protein
MTTTLESRDQYRTAYEQAKKALAPLLIPQAVDASHPNPYLDARFLVAEKVQSILPDLVKSADEFQVYDAHAMLMTHARYELTRVYSWAIPSPHAIRLIASLGPVLEMGAGTGYWARLLDEAGADVLALDHAPPNQEFNRFCAGETWFNVQRGTPKDLSVFSDRTLMLCWPSLNTPFAVQSLRHYTGSTLVYIGEQKHGCTADDHFFDHLEARWRLQEDIEIPQWPHIDDHLYIYTRA